VVPKALHGGSTNAAIASITVFTGFLAALICVCSSRPGSNIIEKIEHEGAAVWREVDQEIAALFRRRKSRRYGVAIDPCLLLGSGIEAIALESRYACSSAAPDDKEGLGLAFLAEHHTRLGKFGPFRI